MSYRVLESAVVSYRVLEPAVVTYRVLEPAVVFYRVLEPAVVSYRVLEPAGYTRLRCYDNHQTSLMIALRVLHLYVRRFVADTEVATLQR